MTRQSTLSFDSLNLDSVVRLNLSRVLKHSKESRAMISLRVSELSGQAVSEDSLNAWCATSKVQWRLPLCVAPALCVALDDFTLFDEMLRPAGRRLATEDEERNAKLGELHRRRAEIEAQIRKLEQ